MCSQTSALLHWILSREAQCDAIYMYNMGKVLCSEVMKGIMKNEDAHASMELS